MLLIWGLTEAADLLMFYVHALGKQKNIAQAADRLPGKRTDKIIPIPRMPTASHPSSGYFRDFYHMCFPVNQITFS